MEKIFTLRNIKGVSPAMVDKVLALQKNFIAGKYEFEGGAFMNVESYITKPSSDKDFEAHRKFIDVQILLEGEEIIEVADVSSEDFVITKPYVEDIEFMNGNKVEHRNIVLHAGEFCVLYPCDAHKPGINSGSEHTVKKIVIKLPVTC